MSSSRSGATHPPRLLLALCLLSSAFCLLPSSAVVAQSQPPAEAIARAVALLEREGYSAPFSLQGGGVSGLARYQTSTAYALTVEGDDGVLIEYILLDPTLYTRITPLGWPPPAWEQTLWHPDIPVPGLTAYHPRLPLELLRAGEDWREAGAGPDGARRLEGAVRYITAVYASYEDAPNSAQRGSALGMMRWPLAVELDPVSGLPRALTLEIPAGAGENRVPTTLSYHDFSIGPRLTPPPDAVERESPLILRDAPSGEAQALPLAIQGEGTRIRTPVFRSDGGGVSLRLSPAQSDIQLSLWRIKRGRLLLAGFATAIVGGGEEDLEFAFPATPGDYVVEVELPDPASWSLSVEDGGNVPLPEPMSLPAFNIARR
jgi:hypothetical protein